MSVRTRLAIKLLRMAEEGQPIDPLEARIAVAELRGHDEPELLPPTRAQLEVLRAVMAFQNEKKLPPTYREIAYVLDRAVSTVHQHVEELVAKGHPRRQSQRNRALAVTRRGARAVSSSHKTP